MPYTGDPGDDTLVKRRDAVRLKVGDRGLTTATELLLDAEYTFFLSNAGDTGLATAQPDVILPAAIEAAGALQALFSDKAESKKIGELSIAFRNRAEKYAKLQETLQEEQELTADFVFTQTSKDANRSLDRESDLEQPIFSIGMDDNDNALDKDLFDDGCL